MRTPRWHRRLTAAVLTAVLTAGCSITIAGEPTTASDRTATATATSTPTVRPPVTSRSSATGSSRPVTSAHTRTTQPRTSVVTRTRTTTIRSSSPATPAPAPMPAVLDVRPLLRSLTAALNRHDRKAFVDHFSGPAAITAGRWWNNLDVIGFDAGSVATYQDQGMQVAPDDKGDAQLDYVMAGTHHPSDGTDDAGRPLIGTTQYRIRVHWQSDGSLRVTDWRALRPAPWDCACALVATKGSRVVVISRAAAAGYAGQVAHAADQAVDFQRRLFDGAQATIAGLDGAVIFATDRSSEIQNWFRAPTDPISDVTGIALAYVRDLTVAFGDDRPEGRAVGGSRLAVGPMASGLLPSVLVHELIHYRFFDLPLDRQWLTENPYLPEGVAQYVTELYFGSTPQQIAAGKPRADLGTYRLVMTPARLTKLFAGALPTASQMRDGTADDLNFWYVIAASVFVFLGEKYGTAGTVRIAECGYVGRDVFDCAADYAAGAGAAVSATTLLSGWAGWVRREYG